MKDIAVKQHLKEIRRQLYRNLWASYRGWWQWHKICKAKDVQDTVVVLLPETDAKINYLALLYLDDLLDKRGFKNAVLIVTDPKIKKYAPLFSQNILRVELLSRQQAEDLMQLYCLYEFDKRFIVASLDKPNGRKGAALVGRRGTTQEDIFVIGVYRIYPFVRPEEPAYAGDDQEIKEFLEAGKP